MSYKSATRLLAALFLMALLAAACGQKEGVHLGGSSVPVAGGVVPTEGAVEAFVDADGDGRDDTTGLSEDQFQEEVAQGDGTIPGGGGAGPGATPGPGTAPGPGATPPPGGGDGGDDGGGDDGGGDDGGGDDGGGDDGGGDDPPPGATGQGVTASTITIGIHAPLTGAAPIPSESFRKGKDEYWNAPGHKVAGRQVKVEFRDDKYNPSTASQVCQELAYSVKVFMLIGSGGTDQIAECARVAAEAGIPYVSAGVTELRLDQLPNYFSLSMSYSQQMPLLMQMIADEVPPPSPDKIVGLIASNTANFDDAVTAFEDAAGSAGYTPKVYRPSKQPSDTELSTLAQNMSSDGVTVATPVMAPSHWIKLATNPQVRNVDWRGIGITMGLNTVAKAVCAGTSGAADGAAFFSPWMGLNMADQIDPNFHKYATGDEDDIQWSLWGLNKTIHQAFKKMGNTMTQQAFAEAMTGQIRSGIYPELAHTQSDHFNATSVNVLRMECSGVGVYNSTSRDTFRRSF